MWKYLIKCLLWTFIKKILLNYAFMLWYNRFDHIIYNVYSILQAGGHVIKQVCFEDLQRRHTYPVIFWLLTENFSRLQGWPFLRKMFWFIVLYLCKGGISHYSVTKINRRNNLNPEAGFRQQRAHSLSAFSIYKAVRSSHSWALQCMTLISLRLAWEYMCKMNH